MIDEKAPEEKTEFVPPDYQPILLPDTGRREPMWLEEYRSRGGYEGWIKAIKEMEPAAVIDEVKAAGLRGRGGAGFPPG